MGIIIRQRKAQQNKSLVRVPVQALTMKKRKGSCANHMMKVNTAHSGCASEITILGCLSTSHTVQVNTAHSGCALKSQFLAVPPHTREHCTLYTSETTILGCLSTSYTVQVNTAHSNCTSEITILGCMPTSRADQAFLSFFFFSL